RLTDVADALGVGLPSVSRLCDRLVSAGLLTRRVNPDSRREVLVALTPRARRLVHRVLRRRRDLLAGVVGRLDAGQRAALFAALTALDSVTGAAVAPPVTHSETRLGPRGARS
ncbi:MAG TPA: MarR family transcriptional regulator, partial [Mycobacteriales bacterium]|nr:MarR family transcriptional regulator [Mycobacteriales bacterium]